MPLFTTIIAHDGEPLAELTGNAIHELILLDVSMPVFEHASACRGAVSVDRQSSGNKAMEDAL